MGKALYRKYRSRSFDEVVGQDHIVTTLTNAIKSGKFAHAYLLTGPRGTGKTSVARILAHEVNGLPYSEQPHFDIIEIDAASNNGVEDVRELRDKVMSAPTSATYKVYIIDEVHMLSKPAFNALLKTLEEPPEHVIFILATTEVHKVPETIISRTQRFSFKPVEQSKVIKHLRHIAQKEHITISDEALALIATHGEGSFRDSISLLDQASTADRAVELSDVEHLLGRAPSELLHGIIEALTAGDSHQIIKQLRALYDQGFEASTVSVQLSELLRSGFIEQPQPRVLQLLKALIDIPVSHRPRDLLELTLIEHAAWQRTPAAQDSPVLPPNPVREESQPITQTPEPQLVHGEITPLPPAAEQVAITPVDNTDNFDDIWRQVLQTIKADYNTLYGIARMAKPTLAGDELILATKFPFHQKRLNEPKNQTMIANAVTAIRGRETSVTCTVLNVATPTTETTTDISTISNIFGGAELL